MRSHEKVLIVDDEPFVLKLLMRQLENAGFNDIHAFECAQDALTVIESDADVSLVFCDLQMPGMDGVEFVRYLAHAGYQGGLVLVSGEDGRILQTAERLARGHQLKVLGVLHKPVSPDHLQRVLGNHAASTTAPPRAERTIYAADELQQAIAGGELINYYQPKVDLATGAVVGVEALVRWQHPRDGMVFPDQFVTTAEEHGLIDDLTRSVLCGALRQARAWQGMGLPLQVSVNISMDNLKLLAFPDLVMQAVGEAGIPVTNLILEVTESRLMTNPLASLDILTRLRLKRLGLSIDDFGTGHSSLAQLRDIPFDELKIDQSFVHGACDRPSVKAIFDASLEMARQLNMKSVAEGVEDQRDWDFLRSSGCDLAQGYFIARPMPGAELPAWIAGWQSRYLDLAATAS